MPKKHVIFESWWPKIVIHQGQQSKGKYSFEGQYTCMYLFLKIWNKERASCAKSQQQIKPVRADTDAGKALLTSSAIPQLVSIEHTLQKHLFLSNPKRELKAIFETTLKIFLLVKTFKNRSGLFPFWQRPEASFPSNALQRRCSTHQYMEIFVSTRCCLPWHCFSIKAGSSLLMLLNPILACAWRSSVYRNTIARQEVKSAGRQEVTRCRQTLPDQCQNLSPQFTWLNHITPAGSTGTWFHSRTSKQIWALMKEVSSSTHQCDKLQALPFCTFKTAKQATQGSFVPQNAVRVTQRQLFLSLHSPACSCPQPGGKQIIQALRGKTNSPWARFQGVKQTLHEPGSKTVVKAESWALANSKFTSQQVCALQKGVTAGVWVSWALPWGQPQTFIHTHTAHIWSFQACLPG